VLVSEHGSQDSDCCEILYGHGILWAAAALMHVLRQRNRFDIGDFSKAILLAPEGQMGRAASAGTPPVKGAPVQKDGVQEAVEKFVDSASKSERIISEVWKFQSRVVMPFACNFWDRRRLTCGNLCLNCETVPRFSFAPLPLGLCTHLKASSTIAIFALQIGSDPLLQSSKSRFEFSK
jgi:hypothetical protein